MLNHFNFLIFLQRFMGFDFAVNRQELASIKVYVHIYLFLLQPADALASIFLNLIANCIYIHIYLKYSNEGTIISIQPNTLSQ